MLYASNEHLSLRLRERLPELAQDIYREAFNHAHDRYGREEIAHRVAWAAVKRKYERQHGVWVAKHIHVW
jgi:cation transport regulator